MRRHGVRHFYLADQYIEAADLQVIAESLIERNLGIFYHVMGRPVREYSPEILQRMYRSGCRWISWGVESGSQRLLDLVDKGTNVEDVKQVIINTADAGISNLVMMIFGLPTSTDDDLHATFQFLESIYDKADAFTSSSFVLFDRTPFARQAKRFALHVAGREPVFTVGATTVHSCVLWHQEIASDGSPRSPRGPLEVAEWQRRRAWLGDIPIYEHLPAEHYLLYASHRDHFGSLGTWPTGPVPRAV